MSNLLMTYDEALSVLKQYNSWRGGKGKMPRFNDIDKAMDIAIRCLEDICKGEKIKSQDRIVLENVFELIKKQIE